MPLRNASQSGWVRGLNAAFDFFAQPKGSVPRAFNALLTRRGAWKTCDGSKIISAEKTFGNMAVPYNPLIARMWKELFLFLPPGGSNGYFGLYENPESHISSPGAPTLAPAGTGFTGTLDVTISALDGNGGETPVGASASQAVVNQGLHITWTAVPGAAGYNVYVQNGIVFFLALPADSSSISTGPSATTNSFDLDSTSVLNFRYGGVSVNTTQQLLFLSVPVDGHGFDLSNNLIYTFPASILPNLYTGVAGIQSTGGSSGFPGTGGGTANCGVEGACGPLPLIVQFASKMFLALGNGVSPYKSDGTPAGTAAIVNTFTAQYPARTNSVGYIEGDQIQVTVTAVDYVFQAVQGGTSAAAPPTFSAVLGQTVVDGQVIWKNIGKVSTSPAPRGAAHAEVYAGSLWVANTAPEITDDLLDGPCAIRMSTANNPDSWNPLNAAQISRDDGQEITGIKAFSVAEAGIPTTQQLVVFKDTSSYVINGVFGAPDFSIQQAQTDQGCIAPRTIQFVPGYGLCRMTHLGFSIFDGLQDRLISEEIRPYIFGGQDDISPVDFSFAYFSKAAQAIFPPMYICACPIQGNGDSLLTALDPDNFTVQSASSADDVTLPNGNYFVKISLRGPLYETAVTPEFGPILVVAGPGGGGSTKCIKVTGPSLPVGYLGWRVYYGIGAGNETQFVDFSDITSTVSIVQEGQNGLPPTGIVGLLTRVFCYDLVMKAWAIIDLPFSISVLKQFRSSGSVPITISGGSYDTTIRRVFGGDKDWDGTPIQAGIDGAPVFGEDGSQRIFYRRLVIRGVSADPNLTIIPVLDGIEQPEIKAILQILGANQFDARVDIQKTAENFQAKLRWSGQQEIDALNTQVSPKVVGATAKVFS